MSGEAALAELEACDASLGAALFAAVREPWLARALLHYYTRTASARALLLLAAAPEPHARHLLDALADLLRDQRRPALSALAALLAARPVWLPRLAAHPLCRELPRAAAAATSPADLLPALLALAALAAAAPHAAPPPDLLPALLRAAAVPAPPAARAHLRLAQRALFHALYAAQPCALLGALRAEHASATPPAREQLAAALRPLLASARLHPALLAGDARAHPDLLLEPPRAPSLRSTPAPPAAPPPAPPVAPPVAGSAEHAARAALAADWTALGELLGEQSAPPTPLPAEDAGGEPEAAVEATPENTPVGDTRSTFRFPTAESVAVRAIGPASPLRKEASPPGELLAARLARVNSERRAAMSPVAFNGAAPAGVARPQPLPAAPPPAFCAEEPLEPPRAVRRSLPNRAPRVGRVSRARAASCPPGAERATVAVQTDDDWPPPAALLLEDYYRSVPADPAEQEGDEAVRPSEQLDRYLRELYEGGGEGGAGGAGGAASTALADALRLTHCALLYERWRRHAHAERCRRLLGCVRAARQADHAAAALRDQLRAALAERDLLRARRAAPAPAPCRAELQAERDARAVAEAELAGARADLAAATEREAAARADALEASAHAAALARAAAAAERRADHVRRLRRELLLGAERESRLLDALRAPPPAPPPDPALAALRTALARSESELDAAALRADAATARAHDLEQQLAAKDEALAELRRTTRAQLEDAAARAAATEARLAALRRAARTAARVALSAGVVGAAGAEGPLLAPFSAADDDADALPDFSADFDA